MSFIHPPLLACKRSAKRASPFLGEREGREGVQNRQGRCLENMRKMVIEPKKNGD